jgi:hypothetical protein
MLRPTPSQRGNGKISWACSMTNPKFVRKAGFGHPPIHKYRLIIESVSDVAARELPKPKLKDSEGSGSVLH